MSGAKTAQGSDAQEGDSDCHTSSVQVRMNSISRHFSICLTCAQDGIRELLLTVHCSGVAAVFLRRTLCDIVNFCKLLTDEARQLQPASSKMGEVVHAKNGAQSLSRMKASFYCLSLYPATLGDFHVRVIGSSLPFAFVLCHSQFGKKLWLLEVMSCT